MDLRMRLRSTEWQSGCWTMTELVRRLSDQSEDRLQVGRAVRAERPALGLHDRSRRPAPQSAGHRSRAGRDARRAAAAPSALGREETADGRGAPRDPRRDVAESVDGVRRMLKARGLVAPRRRRQPAARRAASPLAPITRANDVWTTDFKGQFRTGDRRVLLSADAARRLQPIRPALRRPDRAHATPPRGRGSNVRLPSTGCPTGFAATTGPPFGGTGLGAPVAPCRSGGSASGIVPERIALGPSRTERVARAISRGPQSRHRAAAGRPRAARNNAASPLLRRVQPRAAARGAWTRTRAGERYQPSPRPLPRRLPAARVSRPRGNSPRRRRSARSRGAAPLFVSVALAGEDVAFEEVDDGIWTVTLCHRRPRSLRRTSAPDSPDCPDLGGALRQLRWRLGTKD